jgi:hypothetical protein
MNAREKRLEKFMTQREEKAAPAVICACDPDTVSPAFAIFSGGNLSYWNALGGRRLKVDRLKAEGKIINPMGSLLSEVKGIIDQWQPDLLVIENQYLLPCLISFVQTNGKIRFAIK